MRKRHKMTAVSIVAGMGALAVLLALLCDCGRAGLPAAQAAAHTNIADGESVIINEVDVDTPGYDKEEFIELYDGGVGNTSLDGLVVVLFNGNGDVSYEAFDLDGHSTDTDGYFVIGSVPEADLHVNPGGQGWLQNGADAVALYTGDAVVLTGTVEYSGVERRVVVLANHFKSKRGGADANQRRLEQAQFVAGLVDGFATSVPNIVVLGDLNDFEDSPPLEALCASGNLTNTWYTLPAEVRYSYIYHGVSQVLDHVLVSPALLLWLEDTGSLHTSADFPYNPYAGDSTVIWRTSDNDPVAATFILPQQVYLPLVMRQH